MQVYNTMDGALLVPYQAVVQRSQWNSLASRFEAAWKVHKDRTDTARLVEGAVTLRPYVKSLNPYRIQNQ